MSSIATYVLLSDGREIAYVNDKAFLVFNPNKPYPPVTEITMFSPYEFVNEMSNILGSEPVFHFDVAPLSLKKSNYSDLFATLPKKPVNKYSLLQLKELWKRLGTIPVDEITQDDDYIAISEPFLHFPIGTDTHQIWQWFESQNVGFSVAEMLYECS
ncbi:hypothetical protein [Photorhabdus aegyptia]|uniref:Uncharacterized protein n=1 Tax=Photorhabdus aegyptia TaxID=2805098 RepID=A0A022PNU3_9GAMM|nr:hypothetical protein [Photorhabdus aegyptia]EYU16558.1 hypothetical protein BA1DRAFT_00842 [Photorhabdus aegyptia]